SAVLHSPEAVSVSVRIMQAFVAMRRFMLANAQVFQRLDRLEIRQLETDQKFVCNLIRSADKHIILIDNYVDDTVLAMLDKRNAGVEASIYTQKAGDQFKIDIAKHDAQYSAIPPGPEAAPPARRGRLSSLRSEGPGKAPRQRAR
ncbi:MAG: hypothetical protein IJP93_01400, partial [Bacteroidales bacterium]|nr:hypothetical protein [Bacteroidales bacterium]